MKNAVLVFGVAAVCLSGCAQAVWNKAGASEQDFRMAQGQCKAQAYAAPNAFDFLPVFNNCMIGQGWYRS